jgi:phosphoribosyl-AMP cyclohydrolase
MVPVGCSALYIGRQAQFVATAPECSMSNLFHARGSVAEVEGGLKFQPKFDADGLIPAIVTDAAGGGVLMFAWMNADALALTIDTGIAHFWTRSRKKIWKKGEESGNLLIIKQLRTDCDQDALWLTVETQGEGVACHTGATSCFYRSVPVRSGVAHATLMLEKL